MRLLGYFDAKGNGFLGVQVPTPLAQMLPVCKSLSLEGSVLGNLDANIPNIPNCKLVNPQDKSTFRNKQLWFSLGLSWIITYICPNPPQNLLILYSTAADLKRIR